MKIHEPPMQFKNDEVAARWMKGLENNSDPYGNAVYRFASEWATRMQDKMVNGLTIEQCAKDASHEANDEGITGYMYGCAVNILSSCWAHGEQLRRWHNLDTQIGSEGEKANASGGVLNPAILTVSA